MREGKKMIIVRKVKMCEIQELVRFIIKHGLADDLKSSEDEYYIFKNNNIICGYGMMERHKDFCIIKNVFVNEENRGTKYGSAIVKTMLNSAELGGAATAICLSQNENFSLSLNFKPLNVKEVPNHIKPFIIDKAKLRNVYSVSLIDYFKNACDGCKDKIST